ncbi:MAG: ATP-binding cassette domain-containing protein [Candidatus Margulisiibacteriota bacterium]
MKCYNHVSVLDGLDLTIKEGKQTTIIGPSGCGKSTLLRLILGLESFEEGEILVNGVNVKEVSEGELNAMRLKCAMVFQSSALFDSMTVCENVGLVLREHTRLSEKDIRKRVFEKLDMVGLADTIDLLPGSLSGGMKKRVAVARAIINDPEMILFDEPTTGLDPITSTTIENLINSLTKTMNATLVVVTHQISTILNSTGRIYMIQDGKAIRAESPRKILKSKNKTVYKFVNGLVD